MIRRLSRLVFVPLVVLAFAGCGGGQGSGGGYDTLRLGIVPNQNPQKVRAEYQPLADYLAKKTGEKVELSVPTSYSAVIEAMANDELDLAHLGGLGYVQARQRAKVEPLVTEINPYTHTTKYHSLIIVPADGEVQKVSQLKGKTFAFGDVSSTSGSLYPAIMLGQAGLNFRTDLGRYIYTGGHDATAAAVANGQVAAGGLEDRILYDLEKQGTVEKSSIRVIERSAPIEGYPWVVRKQVPEELKGEITDAFLSMKDPKLLDLLRAEGFAEVSPDDYTYVDKEAREFDLLTEPG